METHENMAYDTSSVYTSLTVPVLDEQDCTFTISTLSPAKSILLPNNKSVEFAEHLSIDAAKALGVDPVAVHLFALRNSSAADRWLSPGQLIYSDSKDLLQLRIRFYCNIFLLVKDSHVATEYLYLQGRKDFIEGKIGDFHDGSMSDKDPAALAKGLAVMDMVCAMKEFGVSSEEVTKNWKNFLPRDLIERKPSRKNVTEMLHNSYRKNISTKKMQEVVEKRWREAENSQLYELKDDYIKFLVRCVSGYFCEAFSCRLGMNLNADVETIRVNPNAMIRCRPNECAQVVIERKEKEGWKTYFRLQDLHDVSLMIEKGMCQLNRVCGQPIYLRFSSVTDMQSFVSLVDGYRRFTGRFYFNICSSLSNPFLQELKACKCHGPCDKDVTFNKLIGKPAGSFTISHSPAKHGSYRIDFTLCDSTIRSANISEVVCPNDRSKRTYRVCGSEKHFASLQLLLDYYTNNETDELPQLTIFIRPHEDDRFALKLFLECGDEEECDGRTSATDSISCTSKGFVLPGTLSYSSKQAAPFKGEHSVVRRASLSRHPMTEVAVKSLQPIKVDAAGQLKFLSHICQFACVSKTTMLCKYYGMADVDPLTVVLEYFPLADARSFLRKYRAQISLRNLMEMSCQMAMALWSLENERCSTGPIQAKRVFVSEFTGSSIRVKLGPLGLGELVHWRGNLESSGIVDEDNSWDYGTFLWEIFTMGSVPLNGVSAKDAESLYLNGYRLEKPQVCPVEVYKVMEECWNGDISLRPSRCELMRDMNQLQTHTYEEDAPLGLQTDSPDPFLHQGDKDAFLLRVTGNCLKHEMVKVNGPAGGDGTAAGATIGSSYDPWMIDESALKIIERLGEGRYGEVNKALYTDPISGDAAPRLVAVKQLKQIGKCDHRSAALSRVMEEMRSEMEIMKSLHHENIVEIVGICVDPVPLLVMQYAENGALSAYLRSHKNSLSTRQLLEFARDVSNGMAYLQMKDIVHRDLAARNILVQCDLRVVISDFGLARFLDTEGYYLTQNYGRDVPLAWYAPEVILSHKYSSKSDVWSFGVLLFEIFSLGEAPYFCPLAKLADELLAGRRLAQPTACPEYVYEVMRKCWQQLPEDRPHFKELYSTLLQLLETTMD